MAAVNASDQLKKEKVLLISIEIKKLSLSVTQPVADVREEILNMHQRK